MQISVHINVFLPSTAFMLLSNSISPTKKLLKAGKTTEKATFNIK